MHNGIMPLQWADIMLRRRPLDLTFTRFTANHIGHSVAARGQEWRECRTDKSTGAGNRDTQFSWQAIVPLNIVTRDVMPVGEELVHTIINTTNGTTERSEWSFIFDTVM